MQTLEIYGTQTCGYCARAKALLQRRGIPFVYYDMTAEPELRLEFDTRTNGAQTVPQIFSGIKRIGGFNELEALDRSGELQQVIGGE